MPMGYEMRDLVVFGLDDRFGKLKECRSSPVPLQPYL
uniref:Uncharacterized protein n=1 Tax=Anguilla anguilla TaxID=7936 RepID=A0A0E9Q399_ANGAN